MSKLAQQVGRLFMVGYEGAPDAVLEALAEGRAGGVILFSRNIGTPDQVTALNQRFRKAAGARPILIAVDQEGGRVRRLKEPDYPPCPAARTIADSGDPAAAYRWGQDTGTLLKSLGFNLDFAPVLDVDTNPANPIIGDRSYGRTPDEVIRFAREAIRGLHGAGVFSCGKHFPGHGDTLLDSHLALPEVAHGEDRLNRVELAPFAALAHALPFIMTAHVRYPVWDDCPATLSAPIITGILRQRLGFEGVIVSDDLEMAGVAQCDPPGDLAIRSIRAGVDMILVCREQPVWEKAYAGLLAAAERDTELARRVVESAERIERTLRQPPS